jgi:hypothetical protein
MCKESLHIPYIQLNFFQMTARSFESNIEKIIVAAGLGRVASQAKHCSMKKH